MRSTAYSSSHHGTLRGYDSKGKLNNSCSITLGGCSQTMRMLNKIDGPRIEHVDFYFPAEYLMAEARGGEFVNAYCRMITDFFREKVTFMGIVKGSEEKVEVGLSLPYKDIAGTVRDYNILMNCLNYRYEDTLYKFRIVSTSRNMAVYCAYCAVRYLFAQQYQDIVRNFSTLLRASIGMGSSNETIENREHQFHLFQIAHMRCFSKSGYQSTFLIGGVLPSGSMCPKCLTLERANQKLDQGTAANNIFTDLVGGQISTTKVPTESIDYEIASGKFKSLYEKLKP